MTTLFKKKVLLDLARTAAAAAIVFLPQIIAAQNFGEVRVLLSLAAVAALSAALRAAQALFTNLETPPSSLPGESGPASTA